MRILITGHKGFIGQNMVNALSKDHQLTLFEWGDNVPSVKRHDWCIHLGALTSTTETNVGKVLEHNYDFSRYLLNQCNEAGVNFQYASSASVYGLGEDFRETAAVFPSNPYAWSKYLFERYVWGLSDRWQVKVQGFRYFNAYGPYEDHKGDQASPYHKFEAQAKETGTIKLFQGSEGFKRDFVPVERIVDVHKKFFNVKESGLWNLGTGIAKSFQEVAEEIAAKHSAKIEYIPMPDNLKNHYQRYTCADLSNLNKALNENNS